MLDINHDNHKVVLLYRLHILVIIINIFAICMDTYNQKYTNVGIEVLSFLTLVLNTFFLRYGSKLVFSAYRFIAIVSSLLFTLIYINHFATMSLIFILLLPLTTLLFFSIKETLLMSFVLLCSLAILLYIDSLHTTTNIFAQNPMALFNLFYTLIIIYGFGLLYHLYILKTFKELEYSNRQKALLLKEVHHRVKNNLNVIASIIGLQESTLEGKAKEELIKSKSRIESIALVHEMLYRHDDFENIDFKIYIQRLSGLLLSMYVEKPKIRIDIKSTVKTLPLNVMVQLGIMINECVTNSIKYAFPSNKGSIEIKLVKDENIYVLSYEDNGRGHPSPKNLLKSPSLGLKLIHLTVKQLKGTVCISSPKGLKYDIRFEL